MPRTTHATNRKSVSPEKSRLSNPTGKQHSHAGTAHNNSKDRHHMIETAAYFRAAQRSFNGGDPVMDWLEAEAEIDAIFEKNESLNVH